MIRNDIMLADVIRSKSKERFFSWSVPGNPIECEVPENFEGKDMEICVTWGISSGYTVTASLVDVTLDEIDNGSIEVDIFQKWEEIKEKYPELFSLKGTFFAV